MLTAKQPSRPLSAVPAKITTQKQHSSHRNNLPNHRHQVLLWLSTWLVGVALLLLASYGLFHVWKNHPLPSKNQQQRDEKTLNTIGQRVNRFDAEWRDALNTLSTSRLLTIAVARKRLAMTSPSSTGSLTSTPPIRLSNSWIQQLQQLLGSRAQWHLLLSPDELLQNDAEAAARPFSFADQLLLNGCFQGQNMPTEIRPEKRSGELVAHMCQALSLPEIKSPSAPSSLPVLLVRFPITPLVLKLKSQEANAGVMTWLQQFNESESQTLLNHGQPLQTTGSTLSLALNNPLWTVTFTPNKRFSAANQSPYFYGVLAAFVVAILLLSRFCWRKAFPSQRKLARSRFQQTLDFEENLNLIDLATDDINWVTGGDFDAPQPTPLSEPKPQADTTSQTTASVTHLPTPSKAVVLKGQFPPKSPASPAISDKPVSSKETEEPTLINHSTPTSTIDINVFRSYDIRGTFNEGITPDLAYRLGVYLGNLNESVYVGRDCRISSPELYSSLLFGIASAGAKAIPLGIIPTPLLHFATQLHPYWMLTQSDSLHRNAPQELKDPAFDPNTYLNNDHRNNDHQNNHSPDESDIYAGLGGVIITASHNPPQDNGFKLILQGRPATEEQIRALKPHLDEIPPPDTTPSSSEPKTAIPSLQSTYIQAIAERLTCPEGCKVVVDAGNGASSQLAPDVFTELGCQVIPLHCHFDGRFPNRSPDTSDETALSALVASVQSNQAALGLAFDGDGDRLAVVSSQGRIVRADELMMLFARDVLSKQPGQDVIFDVKCSRNLAGVISHSGGRPVMSKTGHNFIRHKMLERNALLGGDYNGHLCFADQWIGCGDGIYAACRLLDIMDQTQLSLDKLLAALPQAFNTPEIRIPVKEHEKQTLLNQLLQSESFESAKVTTLDGIRVDYPKSWGLIRASNTESHLSLRFEGCSEAELARVQFYFKQALLKVMPDLTLPF